MYNTLKRMYLQGKIGLDGLERAVLKGWITDNQKNEIIAAV